MLNFGGMDCGLLDESATYAIRAWGWYPADPRLPEGDGLGRLTIEQQKTVGSKKEIAEYTVAEIEAMPGLMGLRFKLTKLDEAASYLVVVGGLESCSCQAGQCRAGRRLVCKHLDAVRALVRRGLIGDPALIAGEHGRSVLWCLDEPGEPTVSELESTASQLATGATPCLPWPKR